MKMKVFNYSELHFSEGTSFKIHTLVAAFLISFFTAGSPPSSSPLVLADQLTLSQLGGTHSPHPVLRALPPDFLTLGRPCMKWNYYGGLAFKNKDEQILNRNLRVFGKLENENFKKISMYNFILFSS